MRRSMSSLWWRDSNQTASGKPGAVQSRQHGIAVLATLALLDPDHLAGALLMSVSLSETTSEARKPVP